jgi:hypothetical protein
MWLLVLEVVDHPLDQRVVLMVQIQYLVLSLLEPVVLVVDGIFQVIVVVQVVEAVLLLD